MMNQSDTEMVAYIRAMFTEKGYGDVPGIDCPYCHTAGVPGPSAVHMEKPRFYPGGAYEAAHHFDIGVRGDVTILHFSCEGGGHKWALVLGEHKGAIHIALVPEEGWSQDDTP